MNTWMSTMFTTVRYRMASSAAIAGRYACIIALNALQLWAHPAGEHHDVFKMTLEELANIVVTPSKSPQAAGNVTQKIDVIPSREWETSVRGNGNICEVIAKVPGASVCVLSRNDANWGTYGGIGPKYSTYMLLGLPVDAFVDPMSLDLNAIDHIEVQRGPASVFYPNYLSQDFAGNQSPLAGTVNLILKRRIEVPKTVFQTSYGTFNTLNGQLFHQGSSGPFHYFGGSTFEMADYIDYGTPGSWLNMNKYPEYRKIKLFGGCTMFMGKDERQKLSVFCHETRHTGDRGNIYQAYCHQYGTMNAGYDIAINDRLDLQSNIGLRSYDRSWQEADADEGTMPVSDNGVVQMIVPVDISCSFRHGQNNMLSIGSDYQSARYDTWSDPLNGYRLAGNRSSALQAGVYVQEEWGPVTGLVVRGGVRYAYIRNLIALLSGIVPDTPRASWRKLLWSTGARYSINERIAFFANGGSSFAIPTLKSTGGTLSMSDSGVAGHNGQLPNPGLRPESGISGDAGVDFHLPACLTLGFRGFYTRIHDAIVDNVVCRNPSQTRSVNTGSSTAKGGEAEVSQRIGSALSWYVNATGLLTRVDNRLDPDQDDVEIPFSPRIVVNLGAGYNAPFGLVLNVSCNYNNGFYDATSKSGRSFFMPGFMLDAYVGQRLARTDAYELECFAQLYNITDNTFEMPWQFRNTGFAGTGGVKITF